MSTSEAIQIIMEFCLNHVNDLTLVEYTAFSEAVEALKTIQDMAENTRR